MTPRDQCDRLRDGDLPTDPEADAMPYNPPASTERGANTAATPTGRRVWTPAEVVAAWREEGPLVHEPTGLERLDKLTGGGPVYGSRWYLLGAPDAGKTALIVQLYDLWAQRGVIVGLLAVDEEPGDITTRLAQRGRWTRAECEQRAPADIDAMAAELPPVRMYDGLWTIEAAAADLATFAAAEGKRAALLIDSLQTVSCDVDRDDMSMHAQVTARVRAIRTVATRYRLIVVVTSEMNRASYRSLEAADASKNAGDLAAAKESGAVEYSARVMLSLRSVRDDGDKIEVHVAKNKHGPRGDVFYLALDRGRMTLTESDAPPKPDAAEIEQAKGERARAKLMGLAVVVVQVLAAIGASGLTSTKLRAAVRAKRGTCSDSDTAAAVAMLGAAVVVIPGRCNSQRHVLDRAKLPPEIAAKAGPIACSR